MTYQVHFISKQWFHCKEYLFVLKCKCLEVRSSHLSFWTLVWHIRVRAFTPSVRCYYTPAWNAAGYLTLWSSYQTVNVSSWHPLSHPGECVSAFTGHHSSSTSHMLEVWIATSHPGHFITMAFIGFSSFCGLLWLNMYGTNCIFLYFLGYYSCSSHTKLTCVHQKDASWGYLWICPEVKEEEVRTCNCRTDWHLKARKWWEHQTGGLRSCGQTWQN